MRVTIIAKDDLIFIEHLTNKADCSALVASNIAIVQWYDDDTGTVEYSDATPIAPITDFSPYQSYVDEAQRIRAGVPS
jgi:hypothetical protein